MLPQCQWLEDAGVNQGRKPGGLSLAPCLSLPGPKISLTPGTDFSQQVVFHPGHQAWNLVPLQSHSSPPPEEMAPQKGNFELQLCRSHFSSLLFLFSEVSPASIPSILGKSESGGRWEVCGQRQSGLAWAARGAPASLLWASGTRGAQGKPGKPNFAISLPSSAG